MNENSFDLHEIQAETAAAEKRINAAPAMQREDLASKASITNVMQLKSYIRHNDAKPVYIIEKEPATLKQVYESGAPFGILKTIIEELKKDRADKIPLLYQDTPEGASNPERSNYSPVIILSKKENTQAAKVSHYLRLAGITVYRQYIEYPFEIIQEAGKLTARREIIRQAIEAGERPESCSDLILTTADYLNAGLYDADIEELQKYAGRKCGMHTDIDKYLTLFPGLAALGGQASLGKTTFCINLAAQLLARGEHVLYFSLEQRPEELITKFVSQYLFAKNPQTEIDNLQLSRGKRTAEISEALAEFAEKAESLHIIECDFETTAAGIARTVNTFMESNPGIKPIVIIDYLQLIAPPDNFTSEKERIDYNLKALKKMQKESGLFVLVISSFNRSSNIVPISYESFLGTSMIEYTCDYVFGLQLQIQDAANETFYTREGANHTKIQRPEYEKRARIHEAQQQTPKKVEFVAIKNRRGRQYFTANFDYYPAHDYFKPAASSHYTPPKAPAGDVFDMMNSLIDGGNRTDTSTGGGIPFEL